MKKQVALALAAALSLSVAGTALAAPANPFVDVPANHWAYDAIKDLQKDGVVSGYGDGTFRGDRTLTRYEMAAMIAKITDVDGKHEGLVKKLQAEFATELYNLGVRVDALEKNASTIKFTGDARIRYQPNDGLVFKESLHSSARFQNRVRINAVANINEKTKFLGRLKWESNSNNDGRNYTWPHTPHTSNTMNVYFDRAEFAWQNGSFGASAGRLLPTLGQGLIWAAARADGALVKYTPGNFTAAAGYLDFQTAFDGVGSPASSTGTTGAASESLNAFVAHIGYNFNDRANLTAAYLDGTSTMNYDNRFGIAGNDGGMKLWSVGSTIKFGKDWTLTGEYVRNQDAPEVNNGDDAYNIRLKYGNSNMNKVGSYHIYAEYYKFGGDAVFGQGSDMFGPTPGQWGLTGGYIGGSGYGSKGWGVGTDYVYAKNMSLSVIYHDLKSTERTGSRDYKGMWSIENNFRF